MCIYFHHPKEAKKGRTHWPQTEKEVTPNIATQEVSHGVCTNPQRLYSWTVVPSHWPAQSPDLNPIENLWDQIKTMVQEQNIDYTIRIGSTPTILYFDISTLPTQDTTFILKNYGLLNSAWEGFPSDRLNNLILNMSRRCTTVIRARGGPTKYKNFFVVSFVCQCIYRGWPKKSGHHWKYC